MTNITQTVEINPRRLERQLQMAGENALDAIDTLIRNLQENREAVEAWMNDRPATVPGLYGNAVGDAVDKVAAFRATAQIVGELI